MLLNLITLQDFCLLACCKTHYSIRPTGPVLTYNKGDRCLKYESFVLKNVILSAIACPLFIYSSIDPNKGIMSDC